MIFDDRIDAARRLAAALAGWRGSRPLVLAIPRGALPMGEVIADALEGELDIVLVHKLTSAWNPEYAVGAIDEHGWCCITDPAYDGRALDEEKARRLDELRARRARYTPGRTASAPRDRVVIVVDDGLATGATMIAALHAVREGAPRRLICAVPVAAPASLKAVAAHADEVVCLQAPPGFMAVGQFYRDFPQVGDAEAIACLTRQRATAARRSAGAG